MLRSRRVIILPDLYVNAGGVIVSYFEWTKNLTRIPFGLMERRRKERRNRTIAAALEQMSGKEILADMRDELLEGGAEIDLVRSGLEDVMRSTWTRIADLLQEQPELGDYRTAAYVVSIRQGRRSIRSDRHLSTRDNSKTQCVRHQSELLPLVRRRAVGRHPMAGQSAPPSSSTDVRLLKRTEMGTQFDESNFSAMLSGTQSAERMSTQPSHHEVEEKTIPLGYQGALQRNGRSMKRRTLPIGQHADQSRMLEVIHAHNVIQDADPDTAK